MLIHSIPHFKGLLDHVPKETKYKHLWDQGFPRSGAVLPSRKSILLLLMCPELPGQPGLPSLGCLQPKPISRLEKWLWGQVSHHFRALFNLLLQAQERTENPSRCRGRLQTNVFCSSSGVWEVRCPQKKAQLHLPQPAGSSWDENSGVPCNGSGSASPQTLF